MSAAVTTVPTARRTRFFDPYVAGYLALYGLTLWLLHRQGEEVGEMVFALVIFGGIFPALAWLVTRRATPLGVEVCRPAAETAAMLAYMPPIFAYLIWGVGALKAHVPTQPAQDFAVLAVKLLLWVAVPAALLWLVSGYSFSDLVPMANRNRIATVVLMLAIVALQLLVGRGIKDMKASGYSVRTLLAWAPLAFMWLVFEVGVVEEFFFRAVLQTRLARLLRSEAGGLVVASVLFGLVHAPGFYLRTVASQETLGAHPSVLMAVGYSLVVTSTAGLFLGVVWAHTRNFAAVVLIHAAGDLVPGLVPFIHSFTGR